MAGWVPMDADSWFLDRDKIAGPWPRSLVVLDLRFWEDSIACSKRPRPSVRKLVEAWGWSRSAVDRMVRNRSAWVDPGRKSVGQSGTVVGQSGTPVGQREATVGQSSQDQGPIPRRGGTLAGQQRDSVGTLAGQQRDTSGTPPIETHARSPTPSQAPPPTPTPSEAEVSAPPDVPADAYDLFSAPDETPAAAVATVPDRPPRKAAAPEGPDEWQQAVDYWGEIKWGPVDKRPSKTKGRKQRLERTSQPGEALAARIEKYGLDEVKKVIRWAFRSNHRRAKEVLREGGNLSPKTIFRVSNFPDYLGFADDEEDGFEHQETRAYSGDRGDIAPAPEPVGPQKTGAQWKRLSELDDTVGDKASSAEQRTAALREIELIESNPGAPLP